MTYDAAELEAFRRVAFGRCRADGASVEDAQDCAQDAVAALLAGTDVRHPKAWVATVAHHRYVDLCRLRRRESAAGLVPAPDPWLPGLAGPEDEVLDRMQARWLVRAMSRWPESTRAVCTEVASGLPRRSVVNRLGLTDRAVESHLTRARRLLRALSLLGVAAVFALGRLVGRLVPASKPTAAAVVPSIAVTLVVGGGLLWPVGTEPTRTPTAGAPTAEWHPAPGGAAQAPAGRPATGGAPLAGQPLPGPVQPASEGAPPTALDVLETAVLPLVPGLPNVPAVSTAPVAPPSLPLLPLPPLPTTAPLPTPPPLLPPSEPLPPVLPPVTLPPPLPPLPPLTASG